MKLAIVSTTIRGDSGYRDWDELASKSAFSDVKFFIAGDLNSIPFNDKRFICDLEYISAEQQRSYSCSDSIGWKRWARRNIALLKAIEFDPDFILFIDDDNRPHESYFKDWYDVLTKPTTKQVVCDSSVEHPWHNYLQTGDTKIPFYPRGFPITFRNQEYRTTIKDSTPISPDRIGVFQGISLGDPDIDAMTRIVYSTPTPLNSIQEKNFCMKNIWSPYNTQNTLFSKSLFPLAFTWPNSGRYEDIYASLVWQQFIFNNDMYVHIGDAINYQIRGKRNDVHDLSLEVDVYFNIENVWNDILRISALTPTVFIEELIKSSNPTIKKEQTFFSAYLDDLIRIGY